MKYLVAAAVLLCLLILAAGFTLQPATRIAVFDSRAIAIAHANSSEGGAFVAALRADQTKAKAAKDDKLVKEIEQKGKTYQVLGHLRAFSIGSVAEILALHKAEVEKIAVEAGVSAVVSKHEVMFLGSGVESIDVTAQLCKMFKPSDQAMKWIADVPNHQPLSMLDVLLLPAEQ
jgi:Skp family chaperone for outer membrane proteins